jgi:putative oxidoreductase
MKLYGLQTTQEQGIIRFNKFKGMIMSQYMGLIARVFLSSLYFISMLFILDFIVSTPQGYEAYQVSLMSKGLPGIFAPLSILIQIIFGAFLIAGFKIKLSSYIFAIYSLIWAITYFLFMGNLPAEVSPSVYQDLILKGLQYLSLFGGFLYMAVHPEMPYSLDSLCAKRKK